MPKLKSLSGREVIDIFLGIGFKIHSQKGSHVKLRRTSIDKKETLIIPNHKHLDTGTLRAILRQASAYIPVEILKEQFYSK